ncbi:hypothetical protein [Foetidibacter luteolus]|uniref:hypothetical protein n=1 Tax=Foetidibacter luteolus TaxID=2608880 RepID=UPI00129B5C94|nr:hypothetical protein [Foetidibacter luteolus]
MKTRSANSKDLSHIDNLTDLRDEIRLVRARVKAGEVDLAERWKKLPEESFKSAIGIILPFYLTNKVAGKSWQLLGNVGKLFSFSKNNRTNFKKDVVGSAKQLGLFAALRAGFNLWKKYKG